MGYSQLSDFEINVAVFEAIHNGSPDYKEGENGAMVFISFEGDIVNGDAVEVEVERGSFNPCANPADAWPIITENNISIILDNPSMPCATDNARDLFDDAGPNVGVAYDNPLRAAMIVFLMMQDVNNA
ncbi:phage protein NinX family protein [Escherichia coli]|uniref:phage protein NinX family protein n=1 Tax=Escherichia coli TaxID=562 RepID=UPI0021C08335|nr:phage protein NinX family protein [Escherichia coli]